MKDPEPLLFELSRPGRQGVSVPALDVPEEDLPANMLRDDLPLPEIAEVDLVRHFVRLSQLNHAVDVGFYPLGSCTMKYNPKVNDAAAQLPGFVHTHPYQPVETVQGNLELMFGLQQALQALSGFDAVSLQPSAGAHGEFAGVLVIRAYHLAHADENPADENPADGTPADQKRDVILIPDSAHGTNPASTAMCGYDTVEVRSDERGNVDLDDLAKLCNDRVAGMMLTNPNTLGLFDEHVLEIAEMVHGCGGLLYGDGANFNAIMGIVKPADLGFDVMHFNLHKTFSTPHGGGGPGSGPVAVTERLAEFLPGPIVEREDSRYVLRDPPQSIGRMRAFAGNFAVMVRAYTYIKTLGAEGLRQASEVAVLNANYLRALLQDTYPVAVDRICMHEFVLAGPPADAKDVHTMDVAKRLMDLGHAHPPTVYFPLIVPEAMMIEPTETESKETLDQFAEDMRQIAAEARTEPDLLRTAPHNTPVRRLDEVRAARHPILRYVPEGDTADENPGEG
jgi:glycine dehydrogenase subunit 2